MSTPDNGNLPPSNGSGSGNLPPPSVEQRLGNLENQLQVLVDALHLAAGTPAPAPAVAQAPPPLVVTPPVAPAQFTPPLAPLASPAGASPSLRSLFPDIEPACITAVITHELKASDLYKLDTRLRDSEPTYSLSSTGTFEMNVSKHKAYKTPSSILIPLRTFFAILAAHLPAHSAPVAYFFRYLTHLSTLTAEYEWAAVLEYHTLFFNRRRNDMLSGLYDGWGTSDIGLLSLHVFPHRKQVSLTPKGAGAKKPPSSSSEACRNFNLGKCDSPCAWKRPHTCSSPGCGKDHPLTQHK
ncbi:hypothetical protein B0H19DRAFT_926532 [Mycena capillaripes]|nr:hypothetical protein B0H19DRAFT_926532 [Mycena capillaripes]